MSDPVCDSCDDFIQSSGIDTSAKSWRTALPQPPQFAFESGKTYFWNVETNQGPKGNVLVTAELAGTMGAKRTADLVPLCHPIGLDQVSVKASLDSGLPGVRVRASVRSMGRTGVEMEALTAVSVALLTVYDMVKAVGHSMEIGQVHLVEKTGGTKGDWHANKPERSP